LQNGENKGMGTIDALHLILKMLIDVIKERMIFM